MINFFRKLFGGSKNTTKQKVRELTDSDIAKLKEQYRNFISSIDVATKKNSENNKAKKEKHDSTCPSCGSKNVNNRIKRFQGDIKGSSHGHGWSALSFGESYHSGSINGKFDTNEVNKCNDCENEWKKWEGNIYSSSTEEISYKLILLRGAFGNYNEALNVKWDKNDIKEKFNSIEEKIADTKKRADSCIKNVQRDWKDYSIELVEKVFEIHGYGYEKRKFNTKEGHKFLRDGLGLKHIWEI